MEQLAQRRREALARRGASRGCVCGWSPLGRDPSVVDVWLRRHWWCPAVTPGVLPLLKVEMSAWLEGEAPAQVGALTCWHRLLFLLLRCHEGQQEGPSWIARLAVAPEHQQHLLGQTRAHSQRKRKTTIAQGRSESEEWRDGCCRLPRTGGLHSAQTNLRGTHPTTGIEGLTTRTSIAMGQTVNRGGSAY